VADDDTRLVVAPEARQQQLYELTPTDPRTIGPFRCIHRLKPGAEPINADKPTPLLGQLPSPSADGAPDFVVIKILTADPTPQGRIRLAEEHAWSQEQHVFRGGGTDAAYSWVARDFYQGVSLDQLIGRREWTRERSTSAARVILVGIDRVHMAQEIHCDIKPANVIVNGRRATLIDFESSRDHRENGFRAVEATKPYASPEQLFGGGANRPLTAATDLFSWALTVCQMFAPGRHPYCLGSFDEATMRAIDEAVLTGFAAPEPDLDGLPLGGLHDAVRKALSWRPEARGTARDLLVLLGETGTNTEVLVGATKVLRQPGGYVAEEPMPASGPARWATSAGWLGEERLGWEPVLGYAGAGVLAAFALAMITIFAIGVVLA
jgi:serine/threonine protein kinase